MSGPEPEGPGAARLALDAVGQLPDTEIDVAATAVQLGRIDAPDADWRAAEAHLSELARDAAGLARELSGADLAEQAGALAGLIGGRHRYAGDVEQYDDVANANLLRVIERRRGLPVSLGILWLHCAQAAGWGAHGVDFPGHFLVALGGAPVRGRGKAGPKLVAQVGPHQTVLDVFAGGAPLDARALRGLLKRIEGPNAELRPGVLAPMPIRRVLLRLQENVRTRRLAAQDLDGALACTLDMLRMAPDVPALWREAGAMHQRLDQVGAALRCYARVLELVPEGSGASRIRSVIEELRGRLN